MSTTSNATAMISEHFSILDMSCNCGCGLCNVTPELVNLAEELRMYFKRPIIVCSVCRCSSHNRYVGGKDDSPHLVGKAMDFSIGGLTPVEIVNDIKIEKLNGGFLDLGGIGIYGTYVHVDTVKSEDGVLRVWDCRK